MQTHIHLEVTVPAHNFFYESGDEVLGHRKKEAGMPDSCKALHKVSASLHMPEEGDYGRLGGSVRECASNTAGGRPD